MPAYLIVEHTITDPAKFQESATRFAHWSRSTVGARWRGERQKLWGDGE
jgi:hypothetical protein